MQSTKLFFGSGLGCARLPECPQGLKPALVLSLDGTAEGRALPETIGGIFPAGFSFAPPGLDFVRPLTHGLRRGLHSCAAARLVYRSCYNDRGLHLYAAARLTAGSLFRRFGIAFARCP